MAAVLRLLFVIPLAYVAAVVAAALTIAVGAVGAPRDAPAMFTLAFVLNTLFLGAAAFLPSAIAIGLAEVFAIRTAFYYLAVGGGLGFLMHEVAITARNVEIYDSTRVLTVAAGFVGAGIYWLIAGMYAGNTPRRVDDHG